MLLGAELGAKRPRWMRASGKGRSPWLTTCWRMFSSSLRSPAASVRGAFIGVRPVDLGRVEMGDAYVAPLVFASRIDGVNVMPRSSPSGDKNRLTICPHGSFLFFTSIR